MTRTRCIIIGCCLTLEGSSHGVAGDLHLQGSTFIFNGNAERGTSAAMWMPLEELSHCRKVITLPYGRGGDYFERRGVFIMPASLSLLNTEAQAYVAGEGVPA